MQLIARGVPAIHAKVLFAEPGGVGQSVAHNRQRVLLPGMRIHVAQGCQAAMAQKARLPVLFHRGRSPDQSGVRWQVRSEVTGLKFSRRKRLRTLRGGRLMKLLLAASTIYLRD